MIKRSISPHQLLVAIDGSPPAQSAACIAIDIAKSLRFFMRGLYIVGERLVFQAYGKNENELGLPTQAMSRTKSISLFQEQGRDALRWLETQCVVAGVPITTDLMFGGIPEVVLNEADQADLLVLGRSGYKHINDPGRIGDNFRTIARNSQTPLLIGGPDQPSIERLLLAYVKSENAQNALHWAVLLQQIYKCQVFVTAIEDALINQAGDQPVDGRFSLKGFNGFSYLPCDTCRISELPGIVNANKVNLLVLGGPRKGVVKDWFHKSDLERVLTATDMIVLAV
jgi:nucleotide-binding universal stress UspA family protein